MRFQPDLPVHPHLTHPRTGEPLRALGVTKRGTEIWPVMGGSQPTGEPPAPTGEQASTPPAPVPTPPAPTPQPPAPAPAPQPPTNPPVPQPNPAPATGNGEHGFPEGTPLAQMTEGQQAAYWRYHSRKWQSRAESMSDYDQLKAQAAELEQLRQASMTEQQRAVEAARQEGRAAALAESGAQLVEQFMIAALGDRLTPEQKTALISPLDRKQFLAADGLRVDTAKVNAWASVAAPVQAAPAVQAPPPATTPAPAAPAAPPATGAPASPLDMGQGTPTTSKPNGLEAGRLIAQQRFGTAKQPAPAQ